MASVDVQLDTSHLQRLNTSPLVAVDNCAPCPNEPKLLVVILITDMTTYLNIKFPDLFKSGVKKKGFPFKNSMLNFR